MITVTLQEAKAKLNALVEAACSGQDVVLLKGSKVVATIVPLSADQLEVVPQLTDAQAERMWHEMKSQPVKKFPNAEKAVAYLKKRFPASH